MRGFLFYSYANTSFLLSLFLFFILKFFFFFHMTCVIMFFHEFDVDTSLNLCKIISGKLN